MKLIHIIQKQIYIYIGLCRPTYTILLEKYHCQRPHAPSVKSNGKNNNDMIPGTLHSSARTMSEEGYVTSHRLKWRPLPPNEFGRTAQHVRKGEGRKEGKDKVI